jgi:hypothetical protein
MNDVFNLPQNLNALQPGFAQSMFASCFGSVLQINDVFCFPSVGTTPEEKQANLDVSGVFNYTFGYLVYPQKRSAISIINNPDASGLAWSTLAPSSDRATFLGAAFPDADIVKSQWSGGDKLPTCKIDLDTTAAPGVLLPQGNTVYGIQDGRLPMPVVDSSGAYRFFGWYKDAAFAEPWRFVASPPAVPEADTLPNDPLQTTLSVTVYAKAIGLLEFTDNAAYDIPAGTFGLPIADVPLASAVTGGELSGKPNYKFSATDLPAGLTIDPDTGIISGTPSWACAAGTATIYVQDYSGAVLPLDANYPDQTASIEISYGAMTAANYRVLSDFGTYTGKETASAEAKIDASFALFDHLELNGSLVPDTAYSKASGSTLLVLNKAYLDTLTNATYNYTAVYSNGTATPIKLVVDVKSGGGGDEDGDGTDGGGDNEGTDGGDDEGDGAGGDDENDGTGDDNPYNGGDETEGDGKNNSNDGGIANPDSNSTQQDNTTGSSAIPYSGDFAIIAVLLVGAMALTGGIIVAYAFRKKRALSTKVTKHGIR